jgi:hypothetical protein
MDLDCYWLCLCAFNSLTYHYHCDPSEKEVILSNCVYIALHVWVFLITARSLQKPTWTLSVLQYI